MFYVKIISDNNSERKTKIVQHFTWLSWKSNQLNCWKCCLFSGCNKTELIYKEYLTTVHKLQPNLYSRELCEDFSEIHFILSWTVASVGCEPLVASFLLGHPILYVLLALCSQVYLLSVLFSIWTTQNTTQNDYYQV